MITYEVLMGNAEDCGVAYRGCKGRMFPVFHF